MAEILTDNKVLMERVEMLLRDELVPEQQLSIELTDNLIDEMYKEAKRIKNTKPGHKVKRLVTVDSKKNKTQKTPQKYS